jgi:hypothetical protein
MNGQSTSKGYAAMQLDRRLSKLEASEIRPHTLGPIIRHFVSPIRGDTGKSFARFPGVSVEEMTRAEGEAENNSRLGPIIFGARISVNA